MGPFVCLYVVMYSEKKETATLAAWLWPQPHLGWFGCNRSPLAPGCPELFLAEYFIRVVAWETTSALQWVASVWVCLSISPIQWSWFCFPFMIMSIGRKAVGSFSVVRLIISGAFCCAWESICMVCVCVCGCVFLYFDSCKNKSLSFSCWIEDIFCNVRLIFLKGKGED